MWYEFKQWMFKWMIDEEGDLTLVIAGIINLTKYKEHTIIRFGNVCQSVAPKYIN